MTWERLICARITATRRKASSTIRPAAEVIWRAMGQFVYPFILILREASKVGAGGTAHQTDVDIGPD
jgi:hypothetical protein